MIIDNINTLAEFGVGLEKVSGDIDFPGRKEVYQHDWADDHGEDVILDDVYLEPREIKLNCFIVCNSRQEFFDKLEGFRNFFCSPGLRRIELPLDGKIHLVYYMREVVFSRLTHYGGEKVAGRFLLYAREPHPGNIQAVTDQSSLSQVSISMRIVTGDVITIDWGDGQETDVTGDDVLNAYTHDYYDTGEYKIIMYGDLQSLKEFKCQNSFVAVNINDFRFCPVLYDIDLLGSAATGHLSFLKSIPGVVTGLKIGSSASIYGDLSFIRYLKITATDINLNDCGINHYTKTKLPAFSNGSFDLDIQNLGLSSEEVDNIIIDLDEMGLSNGELNYIAWNSPRTSTSDAAYTSLTGKSWTIN
ncbi:MAG TPA: hypothetical protein VMW32_05680 [Bacteroidales bacterium]|nr:hypothetical protein [Bacteroidales bacterium]